jgi:two-component sensor histidine kinase
LQAPETSSYVELSFARSATQVTRLYRFVKDFYDQLPPEARERIALAVYELCENAVKYTAEGEPVGRLDIHLGPDGARVIATTRNRARPEDVELLAARIEAMDAAGDAFVHYQNVIRNVQEGPGSGLGLARVWYEAGGKISYRADDGCVEIRCEIDLRGEEGA